MADFANQADAPDDPNVAGTLGWVFYRKGIYQSAVQYLEKAVSNDRKSSERNAVIRRYHLAMTYLKLGDQKRGQEALLQALKQDPKLPEAATAQAVLRQSTS